MSGTPARRGALTRTRSAPSPLTPRNPRAQNSENIPPNTANPAFVEPRRSRKKTKTLNDEINAKSDADVWDLEDAVIMAAAKSAYSSEVYDHFDMTLERTEDGGERIMEYVYTCKFGDPKHNGYRRRRGLPYNTSNMGASTQACVRRDPSRAPLSSDSQSTSTTSMYTPARHRTLLALRSAASKRPYNAVNDPWYHAEVQMWRPGIPVPSADTVAEDTHRLYVGYAPLVAKFFKERDRELHSIVDGWTAPNDPQYLGCNVQFDHLGKLYEITLEFIRLTEKHSGANLAQALADTLKRYGLDAFLHLLMMDNAGNCNTTASSLPDHIPTFRGELARARCFDHICNLIARIILSFFFKQPKRKKAVKVAGPHGATTESAEEIIITEIDPTADSEDLEMADILAEDGNSPETDSAREAHDAAVANTLRGAAIREMQTRNVIIPDQESRDALKLFPKVAGLAKKVHESMPVQTVFNKLVDTSTAITSATKQLARRNATRWGSEMNCLRTRRLLLPAVDALLATPDLKLGSYKLNTKQKQLALELEQILKILEIPMKIFQQKDRPLIIDVIPEMERLRQIFESCEADGSLSPVSRVAVHAGLLLLKKYYSLLDACEAYRIAIVMCPHRRLSYFRTDLHWEESRIIDLQSLVLRRFKESYCSSTASPTSSVPSTSTSHSTLSRPAPSDDLDISRWLPANTVAPTSTDPVECLRAYLNGSLCEPTDDVLGYWWAKIEKTPDLAKFALSFVSGPATSCGGERSFSEGRNQMGWNQHAMSSQSFREQMSLGSWSEAPFFDFEQAVAILEAAISPLRS